jgi:hypothetical protein
MPQREAAHARISIYIVVLGIAKLEVEHNVAEQAKDKSENHQKSEHGVDCRVGHKREYARGDKKDASQRFQKQRGGTDAFNSDRSKQRAGYGARAKQGIDNDLHFLPP